MDIRSEVQHTDLGKKASEGASWYRKVNEETSRHREAGAPYISTSAPRSGLSCERSADTAIEGIIIRERWNLRRSYIIRELDAARQGTRNAEERMSAPMMHSERHGR